MPKKFTFEYVKNFIENEGYELLSTEYVDSRTKLQIKCDKGHIFEMIFHSFKIGHRCQKCWGILSKKQQQHDISFIKKYFKKYNYIVVDDEYNGSHSLINVICPNHHQWKTQYANFQQGHRCPLCKNKQITSFHNNGSPIYSLKYDVVKQNIEQNNYELLSDVYLNNTHFIKIKCDKGHVYDVRYSNFNAGCRCPVCDTQRSTSKAEKEIVNYVKTCYNGLIIENDRSIIKNPLTGKFLELDIWMPEVNKAIEFNGKFWHSKKYVKFKDDVKLKQCKEKSINLLVINESEWIENKNKCLIEINKLISYK